MAPGEQLALALQRRGARRRAPAPAAAAGRARARPRRAPPATLSYSSLTRYAQCPYRFHLERGLGLPEQEPPEHLRDAGAPAPALDLRVRGTLVHELLEDLDLRAGARRCPDADGGRAPSPRAHEAELADADVADLQALVAAFAGSAAARAPGRGARRAPRARLRLRAGATARCSTASSTSSPHEADGAALIVDYKSDRVGDADLEALVEAGYGVQRRIYALAALRAGAPAVEVAHLFLERPAEPAVARYEQADAETLEPSCATPRRRCWPARTRSPRCPHRGLCATCPGRAGLCSYPPELTDRELATRRPLSRVGSRAALRSSSALSSAPKRNALADRYSHSSSTIAAREGAVGRAVGREVAHVDREAEREHDPQHDADDRARA